MLKTFEGGTMACHSSAFGGIDPIIQGRRPNASIITWGKNIGHMGFKETNAYSSIAKQLLVQEKKH